MSILRRLAIVVAASLIATAPAWAQTSDQATRPASSTTIGDTGLWFVPLGETLPKGKTAGQGVYVNVDRSEGFSDIGDFNGTFAFGATDKVEIFGGLTFLRRIDADRLPVAIDGQPMDYLVNQGWKQGFGDIMVGAKYGLRSQATNNGIAIALRGAVKLPTASQDDGLGTGSPDFLVDAIVSKEINQKLDVSGFGGFKFRSSPDDYELSNGFRYGFGWVTRAGPA